MRLLKVLSTVEINRSNHFASRSPIRISKLAEMFMSIDKSEADALSKVSHPQSSHGRIVLENSKTGWEVSPYRGKNVHPDMQKEVK